MEQKFGSPEVIEKLWHFFSHQADLLYKIEACVREEDSKIWATVYTLVYSVNDTNQSLLWLTKNRKIRDSFVLSRVSFETIVNICFILANGDESAESSWDHAKQKSYRDLNRTLNIEDQSIVLKYNGELDLDEHSDLKSAIEKFTSKKGREITSWTSESVKERIEVIHEKYGQKVSTGLQFALFSIYRYSSEIAHGTLFGALFSLGLTQPNGPPKSPDDLAHYQGSNICMLLLMLGLSIDSLIKVISRELNTCDFSNESAKAISDIKKESWYGENT